MILNVIRLLFTVYTMMLFIRIIGSWFPSFASSQIMGFVSCYTDPYLNFFRKIIPPIGGVLDVSPILAFFCLKVIQALVLNLFK